MIDLSQYKNKVDGGAFHADEWNSCMSAIENAINDDTSGFYVNDVLTTPVGGIVQLNSMGKYVLRGTLQGRVRIGSDTDTPNDDTFVFLDGVEIVSEDSNNYGIFYACQSQSMYVTLVKNKHNIIRCTHEADMAQQQGAALYSENNMVVQGNGYLTCLNNGGHGVKASELRISGRPHLYVEAIHDGIHGNSLLTIDGGYYFINKANDAFGTGTTGQINILDGEFNAYNIKQNVFDSKVSGNIFSDINIYTDVVADKVYSGVSMITPSEYFGTGRVLNGTNEVTSIDGVYDCTTATEVNVYGYVQGQILVSTSKVKVTLCGAYIECNNGHSLYYNSGSSKMSVKTINDTINFIVQTQEDEAYDAVKSDNNVVLEVKGGSYLIISSKKGKGVDGSSVTFHDSKGVVIIRDCGDYGVQGTEIYFATESDYESGKVTDASAQKVYGAFSAHDNQGSDIHARLSSKGAKGTIQFKNDLLLGIVSADRISAKTSIACENSLNVFFNDAKGILSQCKGKTYEPFNYIPSGARDIPLI